MDKINLPTNFEELGLSISEGIIDPEYCRALREKISSLMSTHRKEIDEDGIKIITLNGKKLIDEIPEIEIVGDFVFKNLKAQVPRLKKLIDLEVGTSVNLMQERLGHKFRPHFDRNEYTVVIYLTNNPNFPIKIYPNIRTDPLLGNPTWLYEKNQLAAKVVYPKPGLAIVFKGRTCLHGVEYEGDLITGEDRVSIQFAFDTKKLSFREQKYYGR